MSQTPPPLALIMGFSVHGLALARALHKAGVEVHAFTPPGSRFAATSFTRYARVQVRERLNAEDLLEHLLSFARALPEGRRRYCFRPTIEWRAPWPGTGTSSTSAFYSVGPIAGNWC